MKLIEKINATEMRFSRNELNGVIMHALNVDLTKYYDMLYSDLSNEDLKQIDLALDMYSKSIPLARVFHRKFFWKDTFYVSPFTLDPRQETEYLVHHALQSRPKSILDIGTGTGCILLSILREFPDAYGVGIDISMHVIEVAKYNADQLKLDAHFTLCDSIESAIQRFDLIVSNPPYVIGDRCEYGAMFDPPIALYDADCYKNIISNAPLNSNGSIILEIPEYSAEHIYNLSNSYNFIYTVLETLGQIMIVRLTRKH